MIIEREILSKIEPLIASPEAIIVTGMRRVGKTTLLLQLHEKLESKNKIFLDLENPLNRKYFEQDDYGKVADIFKVLGLNLLEKSYVFLDEIQFVKNIPSVVKYLADNFQIKFFLSGSASFYLKNLFSESLAGRKFLFELYPFNFREFLRLKNRAIRLPDSDSKITEDVFKTLDRYYDEYILYGGFPGVAQKESISEKKTVLEDIFSSYFQLEVMQLGDFRKVNIVRDLLVLLMQRTGSRLDIQKLSSELGVSRETINNYISFFESTYFMKLISPFSLNKDAEIRRMPKFYVCDSGLVNHFARVDEGLIFENSIFSSLRALGEVNYYQRKSGVEIDFILDKKGAYEVKSAARSADIRKLKNLAAELNIKDYYVISRKYCGTDDKIKYGFMV